MNKVWNFLFLCLVFLAAVSCDGIKLRPVTEEDLRSATSEDSIFSLKPPEDVQTELRVVFFVDQSYSMIHGKCRTDLDGAAPAKTGVGCSDPEVGMDPEGHRFDVIQKWLTELKSVSNTKVAIIPFSGGINERPRRYPYNTTPIKDGLENYKFSDLSVAEKRLTDLRLEQAEDLKRDTVVGDGEFTGASTMYMGTSIPLPTLRFTRDQIYKEMEALQKQNKLFGTRFRFIYISDGVFKPTQTIINKALELSDMNCSPKCVINPNSVRCDNSYLNVGGHTTSQLTPADLAKFPKECGILNNLNQLDDCYCLNVGNDLFQNFGDPSDNDLTQILGTLDDIKALPKFFGEGQVKLEFVKIRPERLGALEDTNIFDEMVKQKSDTELSFMLGPEVPFSLKSSQSVELTYQLEDFYVVNLNAYVNDNGELVSDSDGDGLTDADEARLGTDPLNPRTPINGQSWCLDSIEKKFGCKKVSCSPILDSDNDGLNECEELTLQTETFKKDNSDDSILDYFKVIRSMNASQNAKRKDANGDGVSDAESFYSGGTAYTSRPHVKEEYLVNKTVRFLGFKEKIVGDKKIMLGQYNIKINNLPLRSTLKTVVGSELYSSKIKSPETILSAAQLVGPTAHDKNVNEILILAKIRAKQDANKSYWLMSRKKIQATGEKIKFEIDFSDFNQLRSQ